MRKQRCIKCFHSLAKIAQTAQNKHSLGNNAIITMMTLTLHKKLLLGAISL